MKESRFMTATFTLRMATFLSAHDTWIIVNSPVVRAGDVTYVDRMLGNHGHARRDCKPASKIWPESWTLGIVLLGSWPAFLASIREALAIKTSPR